MLKRITTEELQLGMFIHKLEGNWFSHPFWKRRFLLEDQTMLDHLRDSDVSGVVIDTDRGKDASPGKQATQGAGDPARSVVQAAQRFGLAPVQPQPRFSRPPAV
ncbi:MAG: DUF3391 domain-containing protein, partial [Novosphingobium sp.]